MLDCKPDVPLPVCRSSACASCRGMSSQDLLKSHSRTLPSLEAVSKVGRGAACELRPSAGSSCTSAIQLLWSFADSRGPVPPSSPACTRPASFPVDMDHISSDGFAGTLYASHQDQGRAQLWALALHTAMLALVSFMGSLLQSQCSSCGSQALCKHHPHNVY